MYEGSLRILGLFQIQLSLSSIGLNGLNAVLQTQHAKYHNLGVPLTRSSVSRGAFCNRSHGWPTN